MNDNKFISTYHIEFIATSEARHLPPDLSFSSLGAPKLIGTLKLNWY